MYIVGFQLQYKCIDIINRHKKSLMVTQQLPGAEMLLIQKSFLH